MFTFDFSILTIPRFMRPIFVLLFWVLLWASSCQSTKLAPEATTATTENVNPNLLPMYGKMAKTQEQLNADLKFLEYSDQNFASRQEASQFFATRAWEYLGEGQPDTAMYRFNLAWLLDDTNSSALWGFGAISAQRGNLQEASSYLSQALTLDPNNSTLMVDLASIKQGLYELEAGTKKKDLKRKQQYLTEATQLLQKAVEADPANGYAHYRLSYNNFLLEDYDKAWEHLHKSREIDMSFLDFGYLSQLMEKQEDPKGLFKNNAVPAEAQPEGTPEGN